MDHDRMVRLLAQMDDALDAQQVLAALARYDFQCERQAEATDGCIAYQVKGGTVPLARPIQRSERVERMSPRIVQQRQPVVVRINLSSRAVTSS